MDGLSYKTLYALPEYQELRKQMRKIKADLLEDLLVLARAGDTSKVQYLAGCIGMIEELEELPPEMMPDKGILEE
jgi:hypothetical protein